LQETRCPKCSMTNVKGRLYCRYCSSILEPRTNYWLQVQDFQTTADKDALGLVKSTGVLPHLLNQFLGKPRARKQLEIISREGTPLDRFENLNAVMRECAHALCLERLPSAYVIRGTGPPNAFTFGDDDAPIIVIDGRLVEGMGLDELRCLFGHEMGHIKSRHLLYHSLADTLTQGVGISASFAGLGLISTPMRLALLAWQRESEFSADRAALIASGNPNHVASMFAILGGISNRPISGNTSLLEGITNVFSSHPILNERVNAVFRFSNSQEYASIVRKSNHRRILSNAFTPICQFCGSPKAIEAVFCPECKKSQA